MDDPALDPREHDRALQGLARLNRLSAADRILFGPIRRLAGSEPLTLLDVATGSADVPIALWRRARRANIDLAIRACDISPRAVEVARRRARQVSADIDVFVADALKQQLPEADVVTSSLFLHHLETPRAVDLIRHMAGATRRLLLVSDLRRCARGLALARWVPRLATTSRVVHVDAVRSAEASFTIRELRSLARECGLTGAVVSARFPARMLLAWRPDTKAP